MKIIEAKGIHHSPFGIRQWLANLFISYNLELSGILVLHFDGATAIDGRTNSSRSAAYWDTDALLLVNCLSLSLHLLAYIINMYIYIYIIWHCIG